MLPKKGKFLPNQDGKVSSKLSYAAGIAAALRTELGDSHRAVKVLMKWTGASERTAKNWLSGIRGPSGGHLMSLVCHSDAVLEIFLQLAGRETVLVSVKLACVRSQLVEVLGSIDDLLSGAPRRPANR